MRLFKLLPMILGLVGAFACAQPVPEIYRYYAPLYAAQLSDYARAQGFTEREEEKAVIAHELVHIAQAHNQGYYVDGGYIGPYLLDPVWKDFQLPSNREVVASLAYEQRNGFIQRIYAGNTPDNTIANVIDEINAYRLTAPWVCLKSSKDRCQKQIVSLSGQIELAAQHLHYFRKMDPTSAERFRSSAPGKLSLRMMSIGLTALKEIGGSQPFAAGEMAVWKE